jgi:hypothetical protein
MIRHSDRIFSARRQHCVADITSKRPISGSRATRAGVIKVDANAADSHTAYGGRPEADHARPCRGHFPRVRTGFSIARQKVAKATGWRAVALAIVPAERRVGSPPMSPPAGARSGPSRDEESRGRFRVTA